MEAILSLRETRKAKGLSMTQLADMSGVSRSYISEIEAGKYMPTIEICCKLCKAMQVTPNELIKESYYK